MCFTKAKVLKVEAVDEGVRLRLENIYLPHEPFEVELAGSSDDFDVGKTVEITIRQIDDDLNTN